MKEDSRVYWKKIIQKEKRNTVIKVFIGLKAIIGGVFVTYLFFTGYFQFVGLETSTVKGNVKKATMYHLGHGLFQQRIAVSYFFEGNEYLTYKLVSNRGGVISPIDSS
ncbi:hypothetical protein [Tenacibaculum sp. 190524A02b]|uniref:hypothetical protein n=1 Tax=Tenacibaculum vairaonense TaxID=3137860 RepID=UPI0031FB46BA